jgi:protein-L-isoaspartate(D-aspartate) O-methyltransferase
MLTLIGVGVALLVIVIVGAAGVIMFRYPDELPGDRAAPREPSAGPPMRPTADTADDAHAKARRAMVERDLRGRGIADDRVLEALGRVPRERFVSAEMAATAYADQPLPIGQGQTISQPYIVALMTELARPTPESRALDVGTGSGYQAAVLAELCAEVYSVEILAPLAAAADARLKHLGYRNITVRQGDGYRGWPEHAPFDLIIVAAAPDRVPPPLIDQLAPGGRLVIPVGSYRQHLLVLTKRPDGSIERRSVAAVAFVPMTGEARRDGSEE